jgi:hypothetical protein
MRDAGTPVCLAAAAICCWKGCRAEGTFGPMDSLPEREVDPEAPEALPAAGCGEGALDLLELPEPPELLESPELLEPLWPVCVCCATKFFTSVAAS